MIRDHSVVNVKYYLTPEQRLELKKEKDSLRFYSEKCQAEINILYEEPWTNMERIMELECEIIAADHDAEAIDLSLKLGYRLW